MTIRLKSNTSMRQTLVMVACLSCFFVGVLLIGVWAVSTLEGTAYQLWGERALERRSTTDRFRSADAIYSAPDTPETAPEKGSVLGKLEIPRLGVSLVIFEGTDSATLRRGVGHVEGTALPGQAGNISIAGHRDRFFRPLKDIRPADELILSTPHGAQRYLVSKTDIVEPEDTYVLHPEAGPALTLVTCYPFYYVGRAPQRFIVRAVPPEREAKPVYFGDSD